MASTGGPAHSLLAKAAADLLRIKTANAQRGAVPCPLSFAIGPVEHTSNRKGVFCTTREGDVFRLGPAVCDPAPSPQQEPRIANPMRSVRFASGRRCRIGNREMLPISFELSDALQFHARASRAVPMGGLQLPARQADRHE